jgi:hypothetical protein
MSHPYLSPRNVGRGTKRLTPLEHFVEGMEVLVVDLSANLVKVDHPISRLPGHFAIFLSAGTLASYSGMTLAPHRVGEEAGDTFPHVRVSNTRLL